MYQLRAREEVLQNSRTPLIKCPACGKSHWGTGECGGFSFEGQRWYATDFKGGSNQGRVAGAQDKSESKDKQVAQSKEQHAAKKIQGQQKPAPTTRPRRRCPPRLR